MTNSLQSNRVYNNYFPKIVICLSLVYFISYLTIYALHQYRRFRERKKQQEKKRLKRSWQHSMQRWPANVAYPKSCHTSTSSCTLNFTPPLPSIFFKGVVCKVPASIMPNVYAHADNDVLPVVHMQQKYKNHWISRPKRLALLWYWSVSMGYVEYDHAKNLDALIKKLSNTEKTVSG